MLKGSTTRLLYVRTWELKKGRECLLAKEADLTMQTYLSEIINVIVHMNVGYSRFFISSQMSVIQVGVLLVMHCLSQDLLPPLCPSFWLHLWSGSMFTVTMTKVRNYTIKIVWPSFSWT